MDTNSETTFVRRKFTITEELDSELEQMADNNYQGNVSLCIRQSISDHRETLNGNGDLTIRRLADSITCIETRIVDLTESVDSISKQKCSSDISLSATKGIELGETDGLDGNPIVSILTKANTPLRIEDIIEQVEMKPVDVRQMLGYLIDHGHVFTTSGNPPRYHLANMGTSPNNDRGADL